ncbi:MAG: hypothetical protein BGN86_11390 [Caulobacterales bacterium 68-7]|nr:hypothetical protein [Caulobacterales bacterium]OJU12710.1 MAG: hypothetical protein BGN86_11390 [Caulobacterales bacterium 68-7]
MADDGPIVVRQSRGKALLLFAVCVGFAAVGVVGWLDERHPMLALCAVFFGLGSLVALANLVSPGRLVVDERGCGWTILFRSHRVDWRDVEAFYVVRVQRTDMIGFTFAEGSDRGKRMRAVNQSIAGCDAALPGGWSLKAAEVATLLNASKLAWGRD